LGVVRQGHEENRGVREPTGPYNPVVMDHFNHPRNRGEMDDADGIGNATNPVCGDTMRLFIKVEEQRIVKASFLTFGCGAAIAASSMTTEMIKGKTIEEALEISDQDVVEALGGLPPTKIHCSVLAEKALGAAIADYRTTKGT
jgi:nitrogen fixation NifU-like protein